MKFRNLLLASLPVITLFAVSCSDNDDTQGQSNLTVPETYTFERDGVTTVDFSGQSSRLLMLQEMGNYIKDQAVASSLVDDVVLSNMYSNTGNPFTDANLNAATDKQLRNKTAASKDFFTNFFGGGSTLEQTEVRAFFETQFDDAKAASQGAAASEGVAGTYLDGTSQRLYAANGLEPQQIILKGLMGACLMDQVVNHYLSTAVLDEGNNRENNTNKVLEADKNYTAMEHKWDEAYGYIYGAGGGKFWDSYINQVNSDADFNTVKEAINLAFRKGRAAIVANDYATRDAQIAVIKKNLAKVSAVRAVYYLKDGKNKLAAGDNGIKAFHALSEGYGFIMALRYTNKPGTNAPYFSKTEVNAILDELMGGTNGLWDIDYLDAHLDGLAEEIAQRFEFTVAQAY